MLLLPPLYPPAWAAYGKEVYPELTRGEPGGGSVEASQPDLCCTREAVVDEAKEEVVDTEEAEEGWGKVVVVVEDSCAAPGAAEV